MMSIWKLLGFGAGDGDDERPADSSDTVTVRKIVARLEGLPRDRARYIAMFSSILSRVAHADMKISADETDAMERIVEKIGGLPAEQAIIVVQMAKTQNLLFGGTENFSVTQEFNRVADADQKMKLLECLFAVSASDEEISSAEDRVIRQIAEEMLLEHSDFIAVRSQFREHLSVLRKQD